MECGVGTKNYSIKIFICYTRSCS